ncbi:L,D-transpeptidase family protein [Sulfurimonas sp.]|jgi:murein L,D-transpeptidase YafK|uniref:L,D-transpeptidase family protein n=1 Tax=Sulfurimonas sp. TaxID=2022749 RepID=UPI002A358E9A|nr:L,D-transpeptidase family protein [Sulfurimonas sp.]MDY0123107.1 L,D-transpeptidase family protein [Sulfurimonas sp.]
MKLLLIIFLSLNIYAGDILTSYRLNGIAQIEKEMDLELSKKEYWDKIVENKDTTFGYIESYNNILACDKSVSTLELYSLDENQSFNYRKTYDAFTGKLKGDKVREGDLKTPIGIYQITQKLSKETKLDPFYGPLAFVTSYPNIYDSYRGKNGSGIWIHGLPSEDRDEFTRGCIAINNSSIECLDRNIDIDKTVLIIDDAKVKQNISKDTLSSILAQLYSWRYSWIYDDIEGYLSFYSPEFVRSDGMNIEEFRKYKTRVFKKVEKKTIIFNDINVLPYPNTSNIYQINFKEFYKSDTFKFTGDKTLVIELGEDNKIKILTEK